MKVAPADLARRHALWLLPLLVFGVVLACYWPALHGAVLWDDPAHIPRPDLRSWSGLWRIWTDLRSTQQYYPVLFSAFWVEYHLWGDHTLGYHLVNVFLHSGSCCLLAAVLGRLWRLPTEPRTVTQRAIPGWAPWLAALIFAVHPICVESVAWMTEQKNTLSLFFYLASARAYLEFFAGRRWRWYALASALFVLAVGSKTMAVTLPAALLVVVWWKNGRLRWREDVLPLLPWFLLSLGLGLLTSWDERTIVGAEGVDFDLSKWERVLLAGHVVWFYLGKFVWPAGLNFFYPRWDMHAAGAGWLLYGAGVLAVTGALVAGCRRTRGPLTGWLLFLGGLTPIVGFFNVFFFRFSYVNDHFLYLPCLGLIALVAAGAGLALERWPRARGAGGVLGVAVLAALVVVARDRAGLYRNNETLFGVTIADNPDSWMAHEILATTLAKLPGRSQDAIAQYRAVLRLRPDHPNAHMGLANELIKLPGQADEAIEHYRRAVELQPDYAAAHNNLGLALSRQPGEDAAAEAIRELETALRLQPDFVEAHDNLASVLVRIPGRFPESMAHLEAALRLDPGYAKAHLDMGRALALLPGRQSDAIAQFEEVLRLQPDSAEAHFELANVLAHTKAGAAEAIAHYETALRLKTTYPEAHYNLANLLARLPGRAEDAVTHYEAALQSDPDSVDAHANLANVLAHLPGREADAVAHYETALRIDPKRAWVQFSYSLLLAHLPGRMAEAIAHNEEAVRLKPDFPDAWNGLAILYAQTGRIDDARAAWQKALQADPHYEPARRNLEMLEHYNPAAR